LRRRNWPIALAVVFVGQLIWYLVYTEQIVKAFAANAESQAEIYAALLRGINDPRPEAAEETLFQLQEGLLGSGVPFISTGPPDTVTAVANLPFSADITNPRGQEKVLSYARRLDQRHPPVGDPDEFQIHFGDPPEVQGLRWIPYLQASGLLLTAVLGFLSIRLQRRAEGERAWTAMARELAHQLGTPISSLQGWLELLRLDANERPPELGEGEIAQEIGADLTRLERISNRFELIGREPELDEIDLPHILRSLKEYLQVRLPRLSSEVTLDLDVPEDLPAVLGNEVLVTWALENVVNNSLDALGGTGGTIRIRATEDRGKGVIISVSDTGPGVSPEIRREIFEPGVTTKARGWGVGLALSRRIVEGVHGGRIELGVDGEPGATFHIHLPSVPGMRS
jgi:signal transduction histidine kinase